MRDVINSPLLMFLDSALLIATVAFTALRYPVNGEKAKDVWFGTTKDGEVISFRLVAVSPMAQVTSIAEFSA